MKRLALSTTALMPLCIGTTMHLHCAGYPGYCRFHRHAPRANRPAMAQLWQYLASEWPTAWAATWHDVASLEWRAAA